MARAVHCNKCHNPLPDDLLNVTGLRACPSCGSWLQVAAFPALAVALVPGKAGERIVIEGEAGCFYHPHKKAVVPCDQCGRFLCALCDCELNGRHFCPACLELGKRKEKIQGLEDERFLYGRQAFVLAVLPLFITGLAAIYFALRYWTHPGSLVAPARWETPVALVVGSLQTLAFGVLFLSLL